MNLWILTEEKPKISVITQIAKLYARDFVSVVQINELEIIPLFEESKFLFVYRVLGIEIEGISNIYIKTVSGNTSFVDFLVFKQMNAPDENAMEKPIMAIEETKTSDKESRNTGVCQRVTKFVYIDVFYSDIKKYMLYNEELDADESVRPSETNIIGTNILLTIGVSIEGKNNLSWFKPYKSIDEIIADKNNQRQPPSGNVAIRIKKEDDAIYISGRLEKPKGAGNIGHDPNIGTLTMLSKGIRALGWDKKIVITKHGVSQEYINRCSARNKFIFICKLLDLELEGINIPKTIELPKTYWHYERRSEKVASILLHILGENNGLLEVYQNHAGCERGYFYSKKREQITLPKKAKDGNNLLLPDVVMFDIDENTVILIEGKQLSTLNQGIAELKGYDAIENEYIKPYYPGSTTYRYVSIFGGDENGVSHQDVLFQLNNDGELFINESTPQFIQDDFKPTEDSYQYAIVSVI